MKRSTLALALLLTACSAEEAPGETGERAGSCAKVAAFSANESGLGSRWVALDVSECGGTSEDFEVRWELKGGDVFSAVVDDDGGACVIAKGWDDVPEVFEEAWVLYVDGAFAASPGAVQLDGAPVEYGTGLTWYRRSDDLWQALLPSAPACSYTCEALGEC